MQLLTWDDCAVHGQFSSSGIRETQGVRRSRQSFVMQSAGAQRSLQSHCLVTIAVVMPLLPGSVLASSGITSRSHAACIRLLAARTTPNLPHFIMSAVGMPATSAPYVREEEVAVFTDLATLPPRVADVSKKSSPPCNASLVLP